MTQLTAERCADRARFDLRPARLPRASRQHAHGAADGALRRRGSCWTTRRSARSASTSAFGGRFRLPPHTAAPPPERFHASATRALLEQDGYEHVLSPCTSRRRSLGPRVSSARPGPPRSSAARVNRGRHAQRSRSGSPLGPALGNRTAAGGPGPCALGRSGGRGPETFPSPLAARVRNSRRSSFLQRNGAASGRQARRSSAGLLGRCGPLLTLVEGEIEPLGRVRGHATPAWPSWSGSCARTREPTRPLRVGVSRTHRPRTDRPTTSPRPCAPPRPAGP